MKKSTIRQNVNSAEKKKALDKLTRLSAIEAEIGTIICEYFSSRNGDQEVDREKLLESATSKEAKEQGAMLCDLVDFLIEARNAKGHVETL